MAFLLLAFISGLGELHMKSGWVEFKELCLMHRMKISYIQREYGN